MRRRLSRLTTLFLALLFMAGAFMLLRPTTTLARDCDDNAVIRCGVASEAELRQKCAANERNTQAIFQAFGINCSQLTGLVAGRVTSSNQVYVGDKLVGTNAMTAGRQDMSGSTPIANGAAYRRPPSRSFRSGSLPALVKMDGERLVFAVIMSCGNPVTAVPNTPRPTTPPPPPAPKPPTVHVTKYVQIMGEGGWWNAVTTTANQRVNFRVIIKNTGGSELKNVVVRDVIPDGLVFEEGTVHVDGQVQRHLKPNHVNIGSIAVGKQKEVIFRVKTQDVDACQDERLRNVASAKPENTPEYSDDAFVEICKQITPADKPEPEPQTPSKTPPQTPEVMPNTGMGGAAALFGSTTLLGAAFHQLRELFIRLLNR